MLNSMAISKFLSNGFSEKRRGMGEARCTHIFLVI